MNDVKVSVVELRRFTGDLARAGLEARGRPLVVRTKSGRGVMRSDSAFDIDARALRRRSLDQPRSPRRSDALRNRRDEEDESRLYSYNSLLKNATSDERGARRRSSFDCSRSDVPGLGGGGGEGSGGGGGGVSSSHHV